MIGVKDKELLLDAKDEYWEIIHRHLEMNQEINGNKQ
jgi:hypothetical protein